MLFLIYISTGFVGLNVGSFLNMLTIRLANEESLKVQRSYCPHCRHVLAVKDLIPVISFLWLKGKCRYCRTPISWQYPLVELATAFMFILVAARHFEPATYYILPTTYSTLLRDLIFTSGLIALFILDFRWYIVPDEVSIPLIIFALLANIFLGIPFASLLLGMAIGGGLYFLLWFVSQGRWVGAGDIRLGLLLGAILGTKGALAALFIAYMIGGIIAVFLLATGQKKFGSKLPMGTFLTMGTFIAMVYGQLIYSWFWQPLI
ncbi:hypothetical protein A3H10_01750 [Candidatus Uhrbacteria bacterium RIFCSPLOWO2_12_FULL_46_10]|uniref:Prepilin peptidase n=1 Tax=Candidatus Uhrbacteria bacterium RIFCSPLOWO2_01_FULL_47_25 TaxID=1802402 RepID=A0A1F7USW2_9BACT|nr:MAG: Type 4 prepilin-like protein leader peptide-processing enzyme [Parcubacteria group bacterium GW2011_GWA2_46_9]OGL60753.1 MAG: hypothetical protein A2752_03380 [Candidatus Uhrbacteria bacterium RIFCSPHIGHO2_01_FULL_46_23]OGL69533.1 MAG: hypothetical protein A3D60_00830 [Candidatus Uhrbacteria bacterium RIFCSPHIGHO2_02_FULL_47_29]OGL75995.1 MAG: hypothetical protein A3E96_02050 [Candidatus Uhrbacteria bacterium RIFCSPHIGHO2_12_FULL_46_13]OGL81393.1 MAG: hypothetical protein A2936_00155 [C